MNPFPKFMGSSTNAEKHLVCHQELPVKDQKQWQQKKVDFCKRYQTWEVNDFEIWPHVSLTYLRLRMHRHTYYVHIKNHTSSMHIWTAASFLVSCSILATIFRSQTVTCHLKHITLRVVTHLGPIKWSHVRNDNDQDSQDHKSNYCTRKWVWSHAPT